MKTSKLQQENITNSRWKSFFITAYFFITYFEPYLNYILGSVIKYFMFIVILVILIMSNKLTLRYYHYTLLGWLGYKFMTLLWTSDYYVFQLHYVTHLGIVALLICVTASEHTDDDLKRIEKALWLGSVIIGVLSLFMSQPYEDETNRQVLTILGHQNDPNNQAAFLLYGLAISLHQLFYGQKYKATHIAVIAVNTYSTLLTGSRGGLLSIAVIAFAYLVTMYDKKTLKTNFKKIILFGILIIAAVILIFNLLPSDVSERLLDFQGYEGGNNRESMWQYGLSMLKDPFNLLLGAGWGAYAELGPPSLHNTFLSMLCDVGILGFCLFFIPTICVLVKMVRSKHILPFSIFVAGMTPSFFIEAINKRFFWNAIIFIYLISNAFDKQEKTLSDYNKTEKL